MTTQGPHHYSTSVLALVHEFTADVRPECTRRWERWRSDWEEELRRRHFRNDPTAADNLDRRFTDLGDPVYVLNSITRTWRNAFGDLGGDEIRQMVYDLKQSRHDAAHRPGQGSAATLHDVTTSTLTLRKLFRLPPPAVGPGDGLPTTPVQPGSGRTPHPIGSPQPTVGTQRRQPDSHALRDNRQEVFAFYFMCDTSFSMDGPGIDAANTQLSALHRTIVSNPVIADKCRLGVMRFSTRAEVLLPLSDPTVVDSMPKLTADGVTNYARAFDLLYDTIRDDHAKLEASYRFLRPVVYMLTDGNPTDTVEWRAAARRCLDSASEFSPKLALYMLGDVTDNVRDTLASEIDIIHPTFLDIRYDGDLNSAVASAVNSITASMTAITTSEHRIFQLEES